MSGITVGFSQTAQSLENYRRREQSRWHEAESFGLRSQLREELGDVWSECRVPNWDGYNAKPVPNETLRAAYELLEWLPRGLEAPTIGAEPDGDLTLEWYRSPRRTLSVSVNALGELHFAALIGPRRFFGTEIADDGWPKPILDLVKRVTG